MGPELTSAVRALAMGARALERSLEDMTLPQFRVLTLIASAPERASRLAEKAAVSRPSLTGLLDGLEARGWVRRVEVAGDRRGVTLELTKAGAGALRQAERAMAAALEQTLELAGEQRDEILRALDSFGNVLREELLARR